MRQTLEHARCICHLTNQYKMSFAQHAATLTTPRRLTETTPSNTRSPPTVSVQNGIKSHLVWTLCWKNCKTIFGNFTVRSVHANDGNSASTAIAKRGPLKRTETTPSRPGHWQPPAACAAYYRLLAFTRQLSSLSGLPQCPRRYDSRLGHDLLN
jgi:hypothetical protein